MRTIVAKFAATIKGKDQTLTVHVPDKEGFWDDWGDVKVRDEMSVAMVDHLPEISKGLGKMMRKSVRLQALNEIQVVSDLKIGILPY